MKTYEGRTNRELKKDFKEQTKFEDDCNIKIWIFQDSERSDLFVSLFVDGRMEDEECIAYEYGEEPTKEMVKKAKSEYKYFRRYFQNAELVEEIIYV